MEDRHQRISLVGPSFLIGIGIILLLDNLGYLEWDFWQIFRLWPVLLIVWGLEILLQGRLLGRIIIACVILIGMVGGLWFMTTGADPRTSTPIEYPRDDATSFVLNLQPKVGSLSIGAATDSANLIGGVVSVPRGVHLVEDFSGGTRARLRLDTLPSSRRWWPGQSESWDLRLDNYTLLDILVDQGIGNIDLDLSELRVNQVKTDFGIATTNIALPSSGNYDIYIDGGIGTILLKVPYEMEVYISVDGGIVTKTFPSSYTRIDNAWTSPGYDGSENSVNVNMGLGIGTIVVRQVSSN